MLFEEGLQLVFERLLPMMLGLVLDVRDRIFNPRHADAEGTVAFLPLKRPELRKRLMNPLRRIAFQ